MVDEILQSKNDLKMQIKNLNFYYGTHQVLKNINLIIKSNAITAIIGPSGCGKTTFIRTLNRMNDIILGTKIEGDILLDNKNIYGDIDVVEIRRKIGMVFQRPNPFPKSIFENIAYGLKINNLTVNKGELKERVEVALRDAALWEEVKDRLNTPALDLSGGQQQRLCIARALAVQPKVILFDEPCSALDPIATSKIEELIQKLKERYTIVIVTHNMQQAARASDYTAFLMLGELIEFDITEKIFTTPTQKITEDYITGRFG